MSHRSHTPKGRRARARILRAAEKHLAARGFHGTSMRDVAREARLPLATVTYHFARKERIYAAILETIAADVDRALSGADSADMLAAALVGWTWARPARVL